MKNKNLEKSGLKLAKKTYKWFKKYYGKPCKEYSPGCPNCRAYVAFLNLFESVIEEASCEIQ